MVTASNNESSPIDKVLEALSRLPCAGQVMVFGSVARGSAKPGDVDAVVDLRPLSRKEYLAQDPGGRELQPLLNIAHNLYGWFDPFLRFANDDLLVRSDDCCKWVRSESKAAMLASIDAEARPLLEALTLRQLSTADPSAPEVARRAPATGPQLTLPALGSWAKRASKP